MAKVEKLAPKRNNPGGVNYVVELQDGRSVQVEINPYSSPYFYQPVNNPEKEYVLAAIKEFDAANK